MCHLTSETLTGTDREEATPRAENAIRPGTEARTGAPSSLTACGLLCAALHSGHALGCGRR